MASGGGGFFARIGNLFRGILSVFVGGLEKDNPEAVYEAAINERIKQYNKLKEAVAGIVYLRNKLQNEVEEKSKELHEVTQQIPIAVEQGEDEVAIALIQRKDSLTGRLDELKVELDNATTEAEEAKKSLISFQNEIEKLKREREEMLAKKASAEARIKIREQIDGLSMDADIRALDNVRESIGKLQAQADVSKELAGTDLESKLSKIRQDAATASARNQLEAMKAQMKANKEGDAGDEGKDSAEKAAAKAQKTIG